MRAQRLFSLVAMAMIACGSSDKRATLCDTEDPAPAECELECDPDAVDNTCPRGFFCSKSGSCDAECTDSGGECGDGYFCSPDGECLVDGSCVGRECDVVDCAAMDMPVTTISGTVYAPNGSLPLAGISVYVPLYEPGPLEEGAICQQCGELDGYPIAEDVTDETGSFQLANVPAGSDVPVVIVSGKWRRQITVPTVTPCGDTALAATSTTLPKTASEGDMPRIAISTGSADALECLIRKLGIADSEIGTAGDSRRIHLYADNDAGGGEGANSFAMDFGGGSGDFADSQSALWDSVDHLKAYDIVILSCEGAQHVETKPQSALDAVKAYADLGGRVYTSHWHNIWIGGNQNGMAPSIPDWQAVANFNFGGNPSPDDLVATIDEVSNPKGSSFATWMVNVGASMTRGLVDVADSRTTCDSVVDGKAERWVYLDPDNPPDNGNISKTTVMNFQFTTPQDVAVAQRCGKVVFSDMHVSADSDSDPATPYPGDCADTDLTPQEKALAFMFFDLASCIAAPVE